MTPISKAERVQGHVSKRVRHLQVLYRENSGEGVAALAKLRRGLGKPPAADIEIFALAWGDDQDDGPHDEFSGLHDPKRNLPDDRTTPEEEAAFAAITLFALHQQSKRNESMNRTGFGLGRAARLLGKRSGAREAVRARFAALGTASSWDETLHHARGLIQQFRQHGIALDYGRFARDLFDLRTDNGERVRLAWGRDFYRTTHPEDDAEPTEPAIDTSDD